ncbi:M6 family metalloprotease domain-containing protein [Clostridium botulinum]|nr:M6 family metalloprotease domain-containing protein [Clostridium botulinum]
MRLFNIPQELKQPNGDIINCFASGDEHFNYAHDKNGYIIIQNHENGYYTYANYIDEELVPGPIIVTNNEEYNMVVASENELSDLVTIKDIKIKPEDLFYYDVVETKSIEKTSNTEGVSNIEGPSNTSPTGVINNIVIFIRFSDESEFTDLISRYDGYFNDATSGVSSVYNYFKSTSYEQLFITSTFYPIPPGTTVISYQDAYPRAYYMPYDQITNPDGYTTAERTAREQTLLANAVNSIDGQVPTSLVLDNDGDGRVDDVTFIIYGSPGGWNTLLWPHQWNLFYTNAYINGVRVYAYNFMLNNSLDVSVICHETQHIIGYPDLYNYVTNPVNPVYKWDIMATNLTPPQYSLAYSKYKYGHWLTTIPEITLSGTYILKPLSEPTGNAYKFKGNGPETQFFVVEYRRKDNIFEDSLPGSGLIVSRIDTTINGNSAGPPNGIYVFRPGGTTLVNGSPTNAYLSLESGRTAIGDSSYPIFYQDGTSSGIVISNISSAGETISFGITLTSARANLTLTKSVNKSYATIGDTLIYTIVIKNTGDTTAINVNLIDTIPSGTTFVSGVYQYNDMTTDILNPVSPGIILGDISVGATSTVILNVIVN